ncbi:hypothetical protein [Robbsia sp. KACC 23696]|uniref:hypothetical protein n=1 Tax=Robbsia sp. KACC 23696 TaxID=3149231 RepID=UPI00325C273D
MDYSFSLDSNVQPEHQPSVINSNGSTASFSASASGDQSSGNVAQGGTDFAAMAAAEARQGIGGLGISLDSFNKLTGGAIQGYVDRAKKEQYAQGMAMAAQGQSLQSIEDNQPWYTKLYGPDATTQGAQMFNVNAAMSDAQTSFTQAMPQLRERSPDQVRQYLVGKMSQVQSTGDQFTDAMMQQKLAEQLPQMLDQHMQHYAQFTQEQNYSGFTNMATASARSMQTTLASSNNPAQDDIAAAHRNYMQQIARPDNMDLKSYQRALRDVTVSNAINGNWQAVRAMQKVPEYQSMDAVMKADLDNKIPVFEAQAAAKNPEVAKDFSDAATLKFNMMQGYSPYPSTPAGHAAAMAQMQSINDAWTLQYGDATVPFTPETMADTIRGMDLNNARQFQSAMKLQTEQTNFNRATVMVNNAWASKAPEALKGIPIPESAFVTQLNLLYDDALKAGPGSSHYAHFWTNASANARDADFRPTKLVWMINSSMSTFFDNAGPATPQQQVVLRDAQLLRQGQGGVDAVKAYFGDKAEGVLAILDNGVDISDPKQFAAVRQQYTRGRLASASAQDKKAALAYVNGQDSAWWNPFRRGDLMTWNITDGAKANLAAQVAPLMAQKMAAFGLSKDDAARAAFSEVVKNGELVPGALVPEDGRYNKGERWADYVAKVPGAVASQNSTLYQDSMRDYISELVTHQVKQRGQADMANFDPSDYHVQWGTYLGNGLMNLAMQKTDGSPLYVTMQADEFGKRMAKNALDTSYGNTHGHDQPGLANRNAYGWPY